MAFFDRLGESLTSAGKEMTQKAKEVSEITKLKLDIKAKEDYVQGQYALLGMNYYAKHKDEESCEEAEQFFLIREALGEIDRMEAEVLRLQGAAECPSCGAHMPLGAAYCSSCGARMSEPAGEDTVVETVAAEVVDVTDAEGVTDAASPAVETGKEGTEE